ncbi:MAG: ribbon-helix-helix domain-containing protein [Cyanobium sp.]
MPTRQTSSRGRPKSPRIQVVLPEDLCERLAYLAEDESRTVSNMAKVLIQQGVERLERERSRSTEAGRSAHAELGERSARAGRAARTDRFRAELERREGTGASRQSRRPRRLRLRPPGS